jgi:uncharacterized membrane protein
MKVQTPSAPTPSERSDRLLSALAYFSIVPAFLLLILPRSRRRSTVRFHACQSILLNAGLTAALFFVGLAASFTLLFEPASAPALSIAVAWPCRFACLLVWILCAVRVARGQSIQLPFLAAVAQRQASGPLFRSVQTPQPSSGNQPLIHAIR